ncbi:hypothetical protein ACH4TQ_44555 [Streptomyces sp. NPDC021218]|uniref:hypothetical protein n=1 Tax=Streptomyces sp. NPDC021218 TaxID=3365119 RepID=UPI0037ADEBE7
MSELVTAIASGVAGLAVGGMASAVQVWRVKRNASDAEASRKARDALVVGEIRAAGQAWIDYLFRACNRVAEGDRVDLQQFRDRVDELREAAYGAMAKIPPSGAGDFFYGPFATYMRSLERHAEGAVRLNDAALARWLLGQADTPYGDLFRNAESQRQMSTKHLYRLIESGDLNLGSSGDGTQGGEA